MFSKKSDKKIPNVLGRRTFLGGVATAILSTTLLSGVAQAETSLRWAHVYESGSAYNQATVWAADEIKKRTDGRVNIKTFPASSLGKEDELNEAISFGSVDIIYTGPTFAGHSYPPIQISEYPFVFRDYGHWASYRDSDLFREMQAGYAKATGNHITALTYYGSRHVTSNKPISKPEDMEGLKIRVPNAPLYLMFPKAVGGNPTPLAFSEVYLALQQGVVDAQENPLPTIQFKKFYEVQKYINLTGHMTNSILTVISDSAKNKLSPADYDTLVKVTEEAAARASNEISDQENSLVDWFTEQGVTVNQVNKQLFMDAVKPAFEASELPFTMEQLDRLKAL